MLLILIPLVLNFAAGIALWTSPVLLPVKLIMTVAIVVKFALYLYSVFLADGESQQRAGAYLCIMANALLVIAAIIFSIWQAAILLVLALALFLVWKWNAGDFTKQ